MGNETTVGNPNPEPSTAAAVLHLARQGFRREGPANRPDAPAREIAKLACVASYGALVWESVRRGTVAEQAGFEELERVFRAAVQHDLLRAGPRSEVVDALERARQDGSLRLPVLLYKGAHLQRTVFAGRTHLRPMVDLDLLVGGSDLTAVRRLLAELGHCPAPMAGPDLLRRWTHEELWTKPVGDIVVQVDLHRAIDYPTRGQGRVRHLLDAAEPLPGEPPAFGLAPQQLVAYLAVHAAGHGFRDALRAVTDLDLFIEHERIHLSELDGADPVLRTARTPLSVMLDLRSRLTARASPGSEALPRRLRSRSWRHPLLLRLAEAELSSLVSPRHRGSGPRNQLRVLLARDELPRQLHHLAFLAFVHAAHRLGVGAPRVLPEVGAVVAEVRASQGTTPGDETSG